MPRKSLSRGTAIEFIPVQQTVILDDLEIRKTDGTAFAPSHVFMGYLDGRHYSTQVYTLMELRAMVMLLGSPVSSKCVADAIAKASHYVSSVTQKSLVEGYSSGLHYAAVRDFAFMRDSENRWVYGEERERPEVLKHPLCVKHPNKCTHAHLQVSVDTYEREIEDVKFVLSVWPPAHPGKSIEFPLVGRQLLHKAIIDAMESTAAPYLHPSNVVKEG